MKNHNLGRYLEQQAEHFLIKHGLRILHRNYACKQGEIDLIASDQTQFVFVEVRGRSPSQFGSPKETIHLKKQKKIVATATHYIRKYPKAINCRFDVVSIHFENKDNAISVETIEWLKNAFYIDGWSW